MTTVLTYNNHDFDSLEEEIELLDQQESLRIDAEQGLASAIDEMESLKSELSGGEGESIVAACKQSIISSIEGQFGLASVVLGAKDGGNVTTTHNFEQGITANSADAKKYQEMAYKLESGTKEVRKNYAKDLSDSRKATFQANDKIIDGYTGNELTKDGRTHFDHIVPVAEIEKSAAMNLHLTPEKRAKIASNDINITPTNASANQSKGDRKLKDWLEAKHKTGKTNAEFYNIDVKMAQEKDKKARAHIKKETNKAAIKKYTSEVLTTGAKDAAKMAVYSAIGVILKDFVTAVFEAIKEAFANRKNTTFKEVFRIFKDKMKGVMEELKGKWKSILSDSIEGGLTAFFSNLLVFVINIFATTLKKVVHMIRAGFVSLVQAVKLMVNSPAGMSKEDARFEAAKIMVAGLIGAASLGLSAAVEKFLQSIPGLQPLMMYPLPFAGEDGQTVSDVLAVTLTSMLGGVLATIVIYMMDKMRAKSKRDKLQIQLVYQSGAVVQYSNILTWYSLSDAFKDMFNAANQELAQLENTQKEIEKSAESVAESAQGYASAIARLTARRKA